jgi:SAM-dependent methyltransferase
MRPGPTAPHRATRAGRAPVEDASRPRPSPAAVRFRDADRYRAEREWSRYEGTPQRELWRGLRERFLGRHANPSGWTLDLGCGPGRFTLALRTSPARTVAFDVSREMLRSAARHWELAAGSPPPARVLGEGRRPPFLDGGFGEVAVLGNTLGFAGADSDRLRESAAALVAPGGTLLLEVAPGPGERSRYLARLPASSLSRLLRAPVRALLPRVEREGFDVIPTRRSEEGEFRRIPAQEVRAVLEEEGWEVREVLAVAPALGALASRIEAIRSDAKAWDHLLGLEEELGRREDRWVRAAAVLVAAVAPGRQQARLSNGRPPSTS